MRGRVSRKAAIGVAGLAIAIVAFAVGSAGADYGGVTKAPKDCQFPRVKPDRIVIGCGDFSSYVDHLRWTDWGHQRARGHGKLQLNDCTPSCADGTFHHYPAKARLHDPELTRCNGRRVLLFTKMGLRFPHRKPPNPGQWRSNDLFCDPH
jgi:hypothetical protein